MEELISIVVPVYNASEYLRQCIESIKNQTYQKLQIILVDDGSTDGSGVICDEYRKSDDRISVIHKENGGSVSARKEGLKKASGAYIGFVDADDYIEPDMYEKLYLKLKESNADFVNTGRITDGKHIFNYESGIIDFHTWDRVEFLKEYIFNEQKILYTLWSKLFRADIVKEAFFMLPDEQCYGEDLICLCYYLSKCERICLYKEAFYHYRECEGSLSHISWLKVCVEESKLYEHVKKALQYSGMLEGCEKAVTGHYKRHVLGAMKEDAANGIYLERYRFPEVHLLKDKRVVIYGAGAVGKDYYSQISKCRAGRIVSWVDKNSGEGTEMIPIDRPEILKALDYDILLIAVKRKQLAEKIENDLRENGLCRSGIQVIWKEPVDLWK